MMDQSLSFVKHDGVFSPPSPEGQSYDKATSAEISTKCKKRELKLFTLLQKHKADATQFSLAVKNYLSTPACKLIAMVEQAKKLDQGERLCLSAYKALATQLSVFQPIDETVLTWDKPKKGKSGTRPIMEFGPLHRAAQYMVKRVISVVFKPKPYQFDVAGRGRDDAIDHILKNESEGFHHVARLDVTNFFGSFKREELYSLLPLPKDVIDYVVMPITLNIKSKTGGKSTKDTIASTSELICAGYIGNTHISGCQTGLPQGSACSPIIAAFLTGMIKLALPSSVRVVIFVDDIFVMAKTDMKLDAAKHALFSAFGKSPAGTFNLTTSQENFKSGIDFIGYNMQYNSNGSLVVSATLANEIAYNEECSKHEKTIKNVYKNKPPYNKGRQAIADYLLYRLSWISSFQKASNFNNIINIAIKTIMIICDIYNEFFTSVTSILKINIGHKYIKSISHPDGYEM
ncbi:MAG: hypothetical protein LBI75_11920, partial [Brucellaceae bacterium]|nr:hypothetical protein [Brucellaceae bacterium]